MIVVDIPMPQCCVECPCACCVPSGVLKEPRTMCRAKESRGDKYVLVNDMSDVRPTDCPIRYEILRLNK